MFIPLLPQNWKFPNKLNTQILSYVSCFWGTVLDICILIDIVWQTEILLLLRENQILQAVHSVDIGGFDDHHSLNFLFIIIEKFNSFYLDKILLIICIEKQWSTRHTDCLSSIWVSQLYSWLEHIYLQYNDGPKITTCHHLTRKVKGRRKIGIFPFFKQKCTSIWTKLPCITLKSTIWSNHIDTRRFKRKFSRKHQLSMVYSTC